MVFLLMKINWVKLFWVVLFSVLFIKALVLLDPDFGWHYQMGKLISSSGIPATDPFSYSLPDYRFIDHEWLSDVVIYKLYSIAGPIGLAAFFSAIAVLALKVAFSLRQEKVNSKILLFGMVLCTGLLLGAFGIRPQTLSWLFFAIFLWLLRNIEVKPYFKYLLPVLFLLWADIHGAFLLGITLLFIYLAIRSFRTHSYKPGYFWLIFFSVLATFINPYGIFLWKEVLETFFSPPSRMFIAEWKPIWAVLIACFPFVTAATVVLIIRLRKQIEAEEVVIFLITFGLSLNSARNLPLFGILVAPIIVRLLTTLESTLTLHKQSKHRLSKVLNYAMIIAFVLLSLDLFSAFKTGFALKEQTFYPVKAIGYIRNHLPKGEVFSVYNWGGYLIWKLPEKKVFIDGRMAHWDSILTTFYDVGSGKIPYEPIFDKYNIQMVLWPSDPGYKKFVDILKNNGWSDVYKDKMSEVLVRTPET